jgi:hypothetical protein
MGRKSPPLQNPQGWGTRRQAGAALELRDRVVRIGGDKLADHDFLFAHERMALTMRKEFDERLLKQGGLAVAKGVDRSPGGDYRRFQFFSRTASQYEAAAEPGLPPQERHHVTRGGRKLLDLSGKNI